MCDGSHDRTLEGEGFRRVGTLQFRARVEIWWHEELRQELIVLSLDHTSIVRGSKHYFLESITEEGETWARDIGPLHRYLESHFPEFRVGFSFFRDITKRLAEEHILRRAAANGQEAPPTAGDLAAIQEDLERLQRQRRSNSELLGLDSGSSTLLQSHLRDQQRKGKRRHRELEHEAQAAKKKNALFGHLQREYVRKGSAACLTFSVTSNVHATTTPEEFQDAIRSIVKELSDAHRYEISQKLRQGRLNIQAAEADHPLWCWVEEWLGGALSPRDMTRLAGSLGGTRGQSEHHLMVTPDEDIRVDDHVKDDQKLLGARVVSTLLSRLDRPAPEGVNLDDLPGELFPARIGLLMSGDATTSRSCHIPIGKLEHVYVSGSTGSGKSFASRVLAEEAALHNLHVLVLDPRNQAAGLLVAEDRREFLDLFAEFQDTEARARAFPFDYFAPGARIGSALPSDLRDLATGQRIVSFKGMDDEQRCSLFARILEAAFDAHSVQESRATTLVVIIEEAQTFTKKRVAPSAKEAGARAENSLDRLVREGRKYGICVVVVSQTIRDFAYDSASIRQNTNTKIFLRNSDREVDYASDFIGDGRQIIRLRPGAAFVHHGSWGVIKVKFRPPFSKVWEFSPDETRALVEGSVQSWGPISPAAQGLLEFVRRSRGAGCTQTYLSDAATELGITSRRQLHSLVAELEMQGLIRTRKLAERGQPRIIELTSSEGPDESRTQSDRTRSAPRHGQSPEA